MSTEAESPPDHESDGHSGSHTSEHHQADVLSTISGDHGKNSAAPAWLSDIAEFDDTFWFWRPSLKLIYDAALARMTSPWAVFAHCVIAALSIVPPFITVPPIIGGAGSLNWFALILAVSGGGKGASERVGRELTHDRCGAIPTRNIGSGEGIIEAFRIAPEKKGDPPGWRESVRFSVPEIDNLSAQGGRSGSTLLSWLRMAFSGEPLGATTIRSGGDHLDEHTYRLTLAVSAQPGRCAGLLEDHDGGTPQRFMWFPANDIRIRAKFQSDKPLHSLDLPDATAWPYPRNIDVPALARDQILCATERRQQGLIAADDEDRHSGHRDFCRLKLAYALAVLDGRVEMNDDDWMLSQFAVDVSDITREHAENAIAAELAAGAARQGYLRAIAADAQTATSHQRAEVRVNTYFQRIVKALNKKGPMTEAQIKRDVFKPPERVWVSQALAAGMAAGLIDVGPDHRRYQVVSQ